MSECSICHETLDAFAHVKLVCNHEFHQKCIFKWVSQKNECPFCKTAQYEICPVDAQKNIDIDQLVNQLINHRVNPMVEKQKKDLRKWFWFEATMRVLVGIQMLYNLYSDAYKDKSPVLETHFDFELPMTGIKYQTCFPDMLAYYASKLMDLS